jgi:hypothetical protein
VVNVKPSKLKPTPNRSTIAPRVEIARTSKPVAIVAKTIEQIAAVPEVPRREGQRVEIVADAERINNLPRVEMVPKVENPLLSCRRRQRGFRRIRGPAW